MKPNPGSLASARGKIPTPRGPILASWKRGDTFTLSLALPKGVEARVELPATATSTGVYRGKQPVAAQRVGGHWVLQEPVADKVTLEVR